MDILFSCSSSFCSWLKIKPERLESIDGKNIGTQTISTNENTMSWQLNVSGFSKERYGRIDVIAVEARSRYAIIFPNLPYSGFSQDAFQNLFLERWGTELCHFCESSNIVAPDDMKTMIEQFMDTVFGFYWVKNTDLSVNGHVADAENWLTSYSLDMNGKPLTVEQAFLKLGININQHMKKAKVAGQKYPEQFSPFDRILEDWAFRFMQGIEIANPELVQFFAHNSFVKAPSKTKTTVLSSKITRIADYMK